MIKEIVGKVTPRIYIDDIYEENNAIILAKTTEDTGFYIIYNTHLSLWTANRCLSTGYESYTNVNLEDLFKLLIANENIKKFEYIEL